MLHYFIQFISIPFTASVESLSATNTKTAMKMQEYDYTLPLPIESLGCYSVYRFYSAMVTMVSTML